MPGAAVLADRINHRHHDRLNRQALLHGREFTGRNHLGKHRGFAIGAVRHVHGGSLRLRHWRFFLGLLCAAGRQGQQGNEQGSDQHESMSHVQLLEDVQNRKFPFKAAR